MIAACLLSTKKLLFVSSHRLESLRFQHFKTWGRVDCLSRIFLHGNDARSISVGSFCPGALVPARAVSRDKTPRDCGFRKMGQYASRTTVPERAATKAILLRTRGRESTRHTVTSLGGWGEECSRSAYYHTRTKPSLASVPETEYKTVQDMPGPTGLASLPYIGSAFLFQPFAKHSPYRSNAMFSELHQKYGRIIRFRNKNRWDVLLFDPDLIVSAMAEEGPYPVRPSLPLVEVYTTRENKTKGLSQCQGSEWAKVRRPVQEFLLQTSNVHQYVPAVNDVANELVLALRQRSQGQDQGRSLKELIVRYAAESSAVYCLDDHMGFLREPETQPPKPAPSLTNGEDSESAHSVQISSQPSRHIAVPGVTLAEHRLHQHQHQHHHQQQQEQQQEQAIWQQQRESSFLRPLQLQQQHRQSVWPHQHQHQHQHHRQHLHSCPMQETRDGPSVRLKERYRQTRAETAETETVRQEPSHRLQHPNEADDSCADHWLSDTERSRLLDMVLQYMRTIGEGFYTVPLYRVFRTRLYREFKEASGFLTSVFQARIAKLSGTSKPEAPSETDRVPNTRNLLQYLLTEGGLEPQTSSSLMAGLFSTATDNISNSLGITLWHLAKNPGVQKTLRMQLAERVVSPDHVTAVELGYIPYLKACVKESLRLTFPTPLGAVRILPTDVCLDGYHIPAGTHVHYGHNTLGHSSAYFDHPEEYRPSRWLTQPRTEAEKALKRQQAIIAMPFGFGPRSCLGRRFAELQMYLALIKIISNFDLRLADPSEELDIVYRITAKPSRPLDIQFHPIQPTVA